MVFSQAVQRSTAYETEMSTPPTLLMEYGPPLPFYCTMVVVDKTS